MSKRNILIASLVTVGIAAAAVALLEVTNTTHWFHDSNTQSTATSKNNDIDYSPATDAEKQDSESHKDSTTSEQTKQPTSSNTAKTKVNVVITTYNTTSSFVSVNGYAEGIIESNGTCKLTLTDSSGKTVSSSRAAEQNATNTTCGESQIARSKLHSGTWQAVLSYSSSKSAGTSEPVAIEVN